MILARHFFLFTASATSRNNLDAHLRRQNKTDHFTMEFITSQPEPSLVRSQNVRLLATFWVIVMVAAKAVSGQTCEPCICQNYTREYLDVTCINVPLVSVPKFWNVPEKRTSNKFQHLYRIRIIGAPLMTHLDPSSFEHLKSLASFTLSKSKISFINETTFSMSPIRNTLSTVEFSYANIMDFPVDALRHLHQLQWLSLKGNQIENIRSKDLAPLSSLRTLFLSENSLTVLEERTFRNLSNLESIDLSFNSLERVEGHSVFPVSLRSLSIGGNLLRKVPESLQNLPLLQVLSLRGNLINHLSPFKLAGSEGIRRIELIDLSHNLISNLPTDLFAGLNSSRSASASSPVRAHSFLHHRPSPSEWTQPLVQNESGGLIEIRNLHLDFNVIHFIPPDLFQRVVIHKLTLSGNRIAELDASTFAGPLETELRVLELNFNSIENLSFLKALSGLRQLYLKNNRIRDIKAEELKWAGETLEILNLSQNLLEHIPSSFSALKVAVKIDLHQNMIRQLKNSDFRLWCKTVKSFSVSKNALVSIEEDTFRQCSQLAELRIGGNKLLQLGRGTIDATLSDLRLIDLSSLGGLSKWLDDRESNLRQPLSNVQWLQCDFNSLTRLPTSLVSLLPSLMYVDLQNCQLSQLTGELNQFANLTTVILSHNQISSLTSGTFQNLSSLESIAIYFNRISAIESGAFRNLAKLHSLVLSKNQIRQIDLAAFENVSSDSDSLTLMLDQNELKCLSANSFRQIETQNVALNISFNQIKTFSPNCDSALLRSSEQKRPAAASASPVGETSPASHRGNQAGQTLKIRVLDVSFNSLPELSQYFLDSFCSRTTTLLANNNLLRSLSAKILSLPHLQTLSLNGNKLSEAEAEAEVVPSPVEGQMGSQLHSFYLRHNAIHNLQSFRHFFSYTPHLTILDLTGNRIANIPENFFNKTALVKLIIADNRLDLIADSPGGTDKCFGVSESLKILDVSFNKLSSLSSRLSSCTSLVELLASHNQIHSFNNVPPLARSLANLQRLELFANPLEERISFAFLSNHSTLTWLSLSNLKLAHLSELHVPFLHRLELSANSISSIPSQTLSKTRNIRTLNLADNQLVEVPNHLWKYTTRLRFLDLSNNPIEILDSSSFAGLKYLQNLYISGLKLQYLDSTRVFLYQSQLSNLKISTYPSLRSFRLQDSLKKCDAIKTVQVDVQEELLSHQIQWAFGGKLRELVITGTNLVTILPEAFQGLNNANDLTLRITNTSIRELPEGLFKYLADIRYISIDLRGNQLETVSPGVFFGGVTAADNVKTWQSRQLLGGIALSNNPLRCDCNLLWLSRWMKQLFAEMKSINIETAILLKGSLAHSRCQPLGSRHARSPVASPEHIPITQLTEEHVDGFCQVNSHIALGRHTGHYALLATVAFYTLINVILCAFL